MPPAELLKMNGPFVLVWTEWLVKQEEGKYIRSLFL